MMHQDVVQYKVSMSDVAQAGVPTVYSDLTFTMPKIVDSSCITASSKQAPKKQQTANQSL